jgi:hypothetical protein
MTIQHSHNYQLTRTCLSLSVNPRPFITNLIRGETKVSRILKWDVTHRTDMDVIIHARSKRDTCSVFPSHFVITNIGQI